uniref:Bet v I/Major latex protein domain-containing protein n=1 Tax=Oryza punctata TaxID=4537 RepID=A0A0E0MNG2_ORYPU
MAPACVSDERAVAVSVERVWKVCLDVQALPKVCAGFVDAVEVEGNGGPGTIHIMKLNPAADAGSLFKTKVVVCDSAAHVLKSEVLEVKSKVENLKSHSTETKLEATGDASCVAKLKVEYELEDGGSLSPEQEKMIVDGYFGMLQMIEAYLVAHPADPGTIYTMKLNPAMAPACVSDEHAVAVSAERLWKTFMDASVMPKACAGLVDDIVVEGNGGPGTIYTMKLNPAAGVGSTYKTRVTVCDGAAHVLKSEVLEAESSVGKLKSHSTETKLEATGDASCVAKLKVEYELEDGGSLSPEKEKIIVDGYYGMLKMIEDYLVAHPNEYA